MNHAKTSFSTEIFSGAIISVVQYLAPLPYSEHRIVANHFEASGHKALSRRDAEHFERGGKTSY
jgi:hypothetical protein